MTEHQTAQIVRSLAGHDREKLFCIVDVKGDFLLLADGKHRKLANPKRKRATHVQPLGTFDHPAIHRLQQGEPVHDSELRKALAAFRNGGNHTWQKTI